MSIGRVCLVAGLLLMAAGTAEAALGGKLAWQEYDAGMTASGRTGKSCVVYFTADW